MSSAALDLLNACLSGANKNLTPYKNFDQIAPGAYLVEKFYFYKGKKFGPQVIAATKEFKINMPKRIIDEFKSQERVDTLNEATPLVMVFGGKDYTQGNLIRAAFISVDNPEVTRYNVVGLDNANDMDQDQLDGGSDKAVVDYCYEVEHTLKKWKM